ncbi:MAG: EF2563 family selenium-dependent molybdenum hydroxylase system protein [Chloroflexi bacterium]|nr:EF2563 family selenium-dependent molybdenum hydroxylase system protein [Chloroflexota bacterium]
MIVLIRGGGDIASGVAMRLHRGGVRVAVLELPQPLAVRRLVSFSEAVYTDEHAVEGVTARRVTDPTDTLRILQIFARGQIPVLVDPEGKAIAALHPHVVVDARLLKQRVPLIPERVGLILGLGPGFTAGENCHAAIETNRGHMLGRVFWQGSPEEDTGAPESVAQLGRERVLRAPADGELVTQVEIGAHVEAGQVIAEVAGQPVTARFKGVMRGLLRGGMTVSAGLKIGDVDPRDDVRYCTTISDKALAVGGGVMEAILFRVELRKHLWA